MQALYKALYKILCAQGQWETDLAPREEDLGWERREGGGAKHGAEGSEEHVKLAVTAPNGVLVRNHGDVDLGVSSKRSAQPPCMSSI